MSDDVDAPLRAAIAYGRQLTRDPRGIALTSNERRIVLLTHACEDMARGLQHAATFARSGKIAHTGAWEKWYALAKAAQ